MGETLENAAGRFWLDDEGILRCVVKEGTDQTRDDALDSLRIYKRLAAGTRRPAVIVTMGIKGLSRDARSVYVSAEAAEVFTAVALVVSTSTVARTIGNFVMAVGKPQFPVRLFDSVEEAVPWARARR